MTHLQYQLTATSGLILEGGGMRGVFTCGVLDCLMDRGIRFPYTIGVSAGACNGLSYMSSQRGRAYAFLFMGGNDHLSHGATHQ